MQRFLGRPRMRRRECCPNSLALNQVVPHKRQELLTRYFIPCFDKAAEMASKILEWRTDESLAV